MADDILRMKATIVSEEFLANVRLMGRELGLIGQKAQPGLRGANKELQTFGNTLGKVVGELKAALPVLGGFGLGAAGIGFTASTLVRTMTGVAKNMIELKHASQELGISQREIRAWGMAAEKVGISTESMMQGLRGFRDVADGLKYNIGGVRSELIQMGAGGLVSKLMATTNQSERLVKIWQFKDTLLAKDPSGFLARNFLNQMQIGSDKVRLSLEEVQKAMRLTQDISPADQARAQAYYDKMIELGNAWTKFTERAGVAIFPGLTDTVQLLTVMVEKLEAAQRLLPNAGSPDNPFRSAPGAILQMGPGGVLGPTNPLSPGSLFTPDQNKSGLGNMMDAIRKGPLYQWFYGTGEGGGAKPMSFNGGMPSGGGIMPASFGGFNNNASAGSSEASRIVKVGVFDASVDFTGYSAAGGGGGIQRASLGGSSGGMASGGNPFGGTATSMPSGAPGGASTGGGSPAGAGLTDEGGKRIDADTMKQVEALGRKGDTAGLQKLFASKGYRMSGPACGIVAGAYVKSAGFKPPAGGAIATNWRDWGVGTSAADINKEGRPFGSMVGTYRDRRYGGALGTPLAKGQTGGHVMNIVPGTYDPKTGTAMFADQHGVRRRSVAGMDLRYAGDESVAAAEARRRGGAPAAAQVAPRPQSYNPAEPEARNVMRTGGGGGDGSTTTAFQAAREAARNAGVSDPDTAASIAMLESGWMKRGGGGVFDRSGGTNPFGQTGVGSAGFVTGKDNQKHKVYGSLEEGFPDHFKRWGGRYGATPEETVRNLVQGGYNTVNPNWGKHVLGIRERMTSRLDKSISPQTNVQGSVNVTVNSNGTKADAKINADAMFQKSVVRQHKQMLEAAGQVGI